MSESMIVQLITLVGILVIGLSWIISQWRTNKVIAENTVPLEAHQAAIDLIVKGLEAIKVFTSDDTDLVIARLQQQLEASLDGKIQAQIDEMLGTADDEIGLTDK